MMRTRLVPAIAVAAILALGACSSTSGTPEKADQQTGSSSEQSADSTGDSASSATGEGDAAAGDSESAGSGDSSAGSDDGSSDEKTSAGDTGDDGAAPTTQQESTGQSSADTGSSSLDDQSAAWFSAACTGMKPTMEAAMVMLGAGMAGAMGGASGSTAQAPDPKQLQQAMVQALTKAGKSLSEMAGNLSVLPPPTIPNGEALAKQAITAMKTAGPKFEQGAQHLADADISSMADFTAAMDSLDDMMDDSDAMDSDLLDALTGDTDEDGPVSAETAQAIKALPACSAMNPLAGAGAGVTAPTPTG